MLVELGVVFEFVEVDDIVWVVILWVVGFVFFVGYDFGFVDDIWECLFGLD